jgi:hypothetical protein
MAGPHLVGTGSSTTNLKRLVSPELGDYRTDTKGRQQPANHRIVVNAKGRKSVYREAPECGMPPEYTDRQAARLKLILRSLPLLTAAERKTVGMQLDLLDRAP